MHVEVENPVCGDVLHLYLKLGRRDIPEQEAAQRNDAGEARVSTARFQVYGCPAAIAAGSLLTEILVGRTREEVAGITENDIDRVLGGLSTEKIHAAVLARDAITRALDFWE